MHLNRNSEHHTAKFPDASRTMMQKRNDSTQQDQWHGRQERFNPLHAGLAAALLLISILLMEPANAASHDASSSSNVQPVQTSTSNDVSGDWAALLHWSHMEINAEATPVPAGSGTLLWMSTLLGMMAAGLWSCTIGLAYSSIKPTTDVSRRRY